MDLDNLTRAARREVVRTLRGSRDLAVAGSLDRRFAESHGADALERELTIGREIGTKLRSRGESTLTWGWTDERLIQEIERYADRLVYNRQNGLAVSEDNRAFAAGNGRGLDVDGAVERGKAAGLARSAEERDPDTWIEDGRVSEDILELKVSLLPWQKAGLQYTRTGYGSKIPTSRMVLARGRWRRVYCTIWSNSGSLWFTLAGQRIMIW